MRSAFSRQMLLIAVLILLTLALMGTAYRIAVLSHLEAEKRATLSGNADAIADLTRAYGSAGDLESSWDFLMSMSLASQVSGADAIVCDTAGAVIACSCENFRCDHVGKTVGADFMAQTLAAGEYHATGTLPGIYDETRYLEAVSLLSDSGETLGAVIVSTPTGSVTEDSGGIFRVFLYTALAVLLIALGATYFVSRREIRPIRALADTVRRFGRGDYAARADPAQSMSAEMDELMSAFNNMADTLQQSERRRQDFIANVSHELKTPMTTIAGFMDGMLDGTIPPAEHPHYMKIVSDEVRRLNRLVRSMLELSRMQAEGMDETKKTRFDLADAVMQAMFNFERQIDEKHIEVDLDLPEKPLYTLANRDAVTQVVYNLIDNAVKFCNDCGYLTVRVRQEGEKSLVSVRNTGPVIPAEELPLIFDRFHKLDKSRSRDPSGVGLGLYIVRTIIGAHGEDIWVESHDGATTFTFTMPAVK